MLVTNIILSATYNTVDAGYKNISVIRTIVCDPFLSFHIEKVPVIRTFFSTQDSVLIRIGHGYCTQKISADIFNVINKIIS